MAESKSHFEDANWTICGSLTVTGDCTFSANVTSSDLLACTGDFTVSAFRLIQTLGGTDVVNKWSTAGSPSLSTGMSYLTFSCGASTFRVACWPTT